MLSGRPGCRRGTSWSSSGRWFPLLSSSPNPPRALHSRCSGRIFLGNTDGQRHYCSFSHAESDEKSKWKVFSLDNICLPSFLETRILRQGFDGEHSGGTWVYNQTSNEFSRPSSNRIQKRFPSSWSLFPRPKSMKTIIRNAWTPAELQWERAYSQWSDQKKVQGVYWRHSRVLRRLKVKTQKFQNKAIRD